MAALDGYRIRIAGDEIAGGYAGWLLAGLGAQVERVSTHPRVALGPLGHWLEAGTEPRRVERLPGLELLADGCDALMVDFGSRLDAARAAEFNALAESHPDRILLALSPFGLSGPWAGRSAKPQELQALSGLLSATGDADHPPSPVAGRVVEMACGVNAANGILLGLLRRLRHGVGSSIDVSALETLVCLQSSRILAYAHTGLVYRRNNSPDLNNFLRCKDGYLSATLWYHPFRTVLEFLGVAESALPAQLIDPVDRGQQYAHPEVLRVVEEALAKRTRAEWIAHAKSFRIPLTPVLDADDLLRDPHLAKREYFRDFTIGGDSIRVPGYPFKGPIWGAAGTARGAAHAAATHAPARMPLEGLRVTEVGLAWSAPMAAETFAQYGADVIKLESPTRLDTARSLPLIDLELRKPWWEYSYNYYPVNAGKRHFGFNAAGPSAADVRKRLLLASDLVVTNYSARALGNLALDGESIRRVNPRCSVVHSTGFGWDGPYRDMVAYGTGMEGMTGLALETGGALGPVRSPLLHPDIFASLHQMLASFAALIAREATGEGVVVDLGQLECGVITLFDQLAAVQGCKRPATIAPRLVRCAGDDQWLSVSPASDEEAKRADSLCARSDQSAKDRLAGELQDAGISAGEMLDAAEVLQLEQLKVRDYFMRVDNEAFGPQLAIGRWHQFRGLRPSLDGVHPFGTDNDAILRETLGFSDAEIERILADGTVGPAPTDSPQPAAASSPIDWMVRVRQIYRWDAEFRRRLGLVRGA